MDRRELADALLNAGNSEKRNALVSDNSDIADEECAYRLKEICYETWNNDPVKAQAAAESISALAASNSDPVIGAVESWVTGISELTKGDLEAAVTRLLDSVKRFETLGRKKEAAQASVASLIPLALQGRYEEAVSTGLTALQTFKEENDQLAAGKIELNLSNIWSRKGDLREAERYGISARDRFIKAGEPEWQALAENDLAHTYTDLNDFRKADEHFREALGLARSASMTVTEAEIEASLGNLEAFRGRFDKALRYLELSRRKFEGLEMPHQSAVADLEVAEIYQTLNLLEEAAGILTSVTGVLREQKLRSEEARARSDLGTVFLSLGKPEEAAEQFTRAAQLFEQEGNPYNIAEVLLRKSRTVGDPSGALELIERATELASGNTRLELETSLMKGDLLDAAGRGEEAEALLISTRERAAEAEYPTIALSALTSLGSLRLRRGNAGAAETDLTEAVEMVESMRAPIAAEEFRMAFLSDKLAPFESLARIKIESGRIGEAFEIIERARSRTLAESVRDSASGSPDDGTISGEIAELREELNWFYSKLNRTEEGESEELRRETAKLERKLLEASRREASTASAARQAVADFSLSSLHGALGSGKALVEYVEMDGVISAFVVTAEGIGFEADLASTDDVTSALGSLHFQFGTMKYGAGRLSRFASVLKSRTDEWLRELHRLLLEPLEEAISGLDLVVVPSGVLNYVPFQALFDGDVYEVQRRRIVTAPGAAVWEALASRRRPDPASALVIGFADENVPKIYYEASAVSESFKHSRLLTGGEATFGNYIEAAPGFPVIHIACHGRFRSDNPMFSSLHLADGNITVKDLCGQRIDAALVTLSACETGLSSVLPGNEILGLARGFLTAGASNIVLSLWSVNDEATARLMAGMYNELQRGLPVSASLKAVQRKMIDEGLHPYFWAPFVIIGTH